MAKISKIIQNPITSPGFAGKPWISGDSGPSQAIAFTAGAGVAEPTSKVFSVAVEGVTVWGNQFGTDSQAASGVVNVLTDDSSFVKNMNTTPLGTSGITAATNRTSNTASAVDRQTANDNNSNFNFNYIATYEPNATISGSDTGFNIVVGAGYIRFRNGTDDVFVVQSTITTSEGASVLPYTLQSGGTKYATGSCRYNPVFSKTPSVYRDTSTTQNTVRSRFSLNNVVDGGVEATTYWFSDTAYDGDELKVGMAGTGHWVEFYTEGVLKHMLQGTYNPVQIHPVTATFAKAFPDTNARYIATSTASNSTSLTQTNVALSTTTTTTAIIYQHLRLSNVGVTAQVIGAWTA